jgi:hypothetical protein
LHKHHTRRWLPKTCGGDLRPDAHFFCFSVPWNAQAQSAPTTPPEAIELNKRGEALLAKKAYKAAAKEFRKALAWIIH